MANIPFVPPPGLVSNDTTFDAPGRWWDASMVRFYQGSWQTVGGWERLTTDTISGACRAVFGWSDGAAVLNIAFGTHQALQVWQGGLLATITPAVGFTPGAVDGTGGAGYGTGVYGMGTYSSPSTADYFPLTWSLGAFGSWLIANPRNQGIFRWENVLATPAALLPNAPARVTYTLCLPQRQIMALGCNEEVSGTFNPLCIRWSDIEDPENWTTATNNNAGEYILEGGGRIVCGRVIGDYVFIWTDVAVYLGTFVGSPDQTWSFNKIGDHMGSISPGGPVISSQTAMWISPDAQFWSCTLGGVPQIVDCPIRDDFKENIALGQSDKIVGSTVSPFSEVVWFYPDGRDGLENSRELRISPEGWCRGRMARLAFMDTGPAAYPVGVDYNGATGNAYWHEKGSSADGGMIAGWIESTDFYWDEAQGQMGVNGVWPDFLNQAGQIWLTLKTRRRPQSTERVHGPWTLSPGQEQRSFRASGRIFRVRYEFNSVPAFVRYGRHEFDVSPLGGR